MKKRYLIYLLTLLMAFSPAAAFADAAEAAAPEDAAPAEELQDEDAAPAEELQDEDAAPAEELQDEESAVNEEDSEEVVAEDVELVEETADQPAKAAGEDPAVIINSDPQPLRGTWNASHTQFTIEGKTSLAGGLFKAPKKNGEGMVGLFYADSAGNVAPEIGTVKVDNSPIYYSYDNNQKGFEKDSSLSKSVTYYQTYDKDYQCYCMTATSGLYDDPITKTKIFLDSKGLVQTSAGYFDFGGNKYYAQTGGAVLTKVGFTPDHKYYIPKTDGKILTTKGTFKANDGKLYYAGNGGVIPSAAGLYSVGSDQYYVNADGSVKTNAGFITVSGKTYLVNNGGKIRKTAGPVDFGGKKYVAEPGGAIRTVKGVYRAGNNLYYITNNDGVVAVNKRVIANGKTYHALTNGTLATGVHKWRTSYYYCSSYGVMRTKVGIKKWNGNYYHIRKGGKISTNRKVKYKGRTYIANKRGVIYRGIFTWKKNMYYASQKGVVRTKAGLFTYDGFRYYSRKGGKLYRNGIFNAGGKKYLALSNGRIQIGFLNWKNKYYLTDGKGAIITKAGIYSYRNKLYYIQKGGVILRNELFEYNDKYYYAGNDGALIRKAFKYKGYWWHPNSKTGEISLDEYVRLHPEAAPEPVETEEEAA